MRWKTFAVAMLLANPAVASNDATSVVIESAREYGVPVNFAIAVAKAESGISCGVVGSHGEVGPIQILPSTSREIGAPVTKKSSCYEQTRAGMKHLALCYQKTDTLFKAAACHNQGMSVIHGRHVKQSASNYASKILHSMK